MSINWSAFVDIINSHERFVLTSHIRPDCDALGSELGMAQILETLGKDVKIVNGHPTPPNLDFIDPTDRIYVIGDTISIDELRDREVLMILDTSAWAQLGPMGDVLKGLDCKKIVLDHHVSEDELGAEAFKNTTAEATGRLVVEAAEQLGVELTPEMSMPIFAALATDTGWFRFSSADGYTYRVGAHLLESGADLSAIYNSLYEQDTAGRVRLRGTILSRIAVELDGRFAHTYVRKIDFENTPKNWPFANSCKSLDSRADEISRDSVLGASCNVTLDCKWSRSCHRLTLSRVCPLQSSFETGNHKLRRHWNRSSRLQMKLSCSIRGRSIALWKSSRTIKSNSSKQAGSTTSLPLATNAYLEFVATGSCGSTQANTSNPKTVGSYANS